MPDQDFVTIAEAADTLNISERTAHRYAAKLSDTDRQKADNGPTLVRLSAMRAKITHKVVADTDRQSPATDRHDDTAVLRVKLEAVESRVADKDAELARVWQSHERLQVLLQDEQRLNQRSQDRIRELEEANAKLILALPLSDSDRQWQTDDNRVTVADRGQTGDSHVADPYENTDSRRVEAPERGDTRKDDTLPVQSQETGTESKAEAVRRPWWRLW